MANGPGTPNTTAALLALAGVERDILLGRAEERLRTGGSESEVNAVIKKETQGFARNIEELRSWVERGKQAQTLAPPRPAGQAAPSQEKTEAERRLFGRTYAALDAGQKPSVLDKMKDASEAVVGQMAHGMTFGLAPDIVGMVSPEAEEKYRAQIQDFRTARPVASTAMEIGGAIPTGFVGAGKIAPPLLRLTGSPVAAATGAGVVGGGTAGAAYGFGESPENRLGGTLSGAATGAAFGGGLGFAGPAAMRTWAKIPKPEFVKGTGELLQRLRAPAGIPQSGPSSFAPGVIPSPAAQVSAQRSLLRALQEGDIDPTDLPRQVQNIGPDAVVADLGVGIAREGRAAINQAPRLSRVGGPVEALGQRVSSRGPRISEALRTAGNVPVGVTRTKLRNEAAAEMAEVSQTLYQPLERLYPAIDNPRILGQMERLKPDVVEQLSPVLVPRGVKDALLKKDRPLSFKELQGVVRGLDDLAEAYSRGGHTGAARDVRKFLNGVEDKQGNLTQDGLKRAMKDELEGYGEAQARWSVIQRNEKAYEDGIKAMKGNWRPDRILEATDGLSPEARNRFRFGMIDELETALGERVGGGGRASHLTNADYTMLARLQALAAGDDEFAELLATLERERVFTNTFSNLQGNSTTAQQALDVTGQVLLDIPDDKRALWLEIWQQVTGLTLDEQRQAATLLGDVLMGSGEEAAELLARDLSVAARRAGGVGIILSEHARRNVPGLSLRR